MPVDSNEGPTKLTPRHSPNHALQEYSFPNSTNNLPHRALRELEDRAGSASFIRGEHRLHAAAPTYNGVPGAPDAFYIHLADNSGETLQIESHQATVTTPDEPLFRLQQIPNPNFPKNLQSSSPPTSSPLCVPCVPRVKSLDRRRSPLP